MRLGSLIRIVLPEFNCSNERKLSSGESDYSF
jgi:hypothetical protein